MKARILGEIVLPKEGRQNWIKLGTDVVLTNDRFRVEFADAFFAEIKNVITCKSDKPSARVRLKELLNRNGYWPDAFKCRTVDQQMAWIEKILETNVKLYWGAVQYYQGRGLSFDRMPFTIESFFGR